MYPFSTPWRNQAVSCLYRWLYFLCVMWDGRWKCLKVFSKYTWRNTLIHIFKSTGCYHKLLKWGWKGDDSTCKFPKFGSKIWYMYMTQDCGGQVKAVARCCTSWKPPRFAPIISFIPIIWTKCFMHTALIYYSIYCMYYFDYLFSKFI